MYKNSGLGIASFVIALCVGLLEFVVIGTAVFTEMTEGLDENEPRTILLGLAALGGLLIGMLGIALGVAGLCEHDRRKTYAILGVAMNAVVIVGVLFVVVLGF